VRAIKIKDKNINGSSKKRPRGNSFSLREFRIIKILVVVGCAFRTNPAKIKEIKRDIFLIIPASLFLLVRGPLKVITNRIMIRKRENRMMLCIFISHTCLHREDSETSVKIPLSIFIL